ncbi:MAG TPA: phosphoribosylaminoimidazolesuccinocarboxamide synthase [Kiritimatiellia bacterium]|nr:phosphoribosylaminoimidazolesuccinocarboxamide synthase [Kiritimatiellia bacterium]HMP34945.1 phosphoribosylaminoimidazolesuccinocarboxamide synthase [Kiritimatiellia bacterium]
MAGRVAQTAITLPGIPHVKSGKVREVFDLGEHYLLVATDRISAFDCVMPNGIPQKGVLLNQLSAWWFNHLRALTPNHVVTTRFADFPASLQPFRDQLEGRSMIVRKTRVLPIECVARGYLIGSGWKEYQATGSVCGIALRPGYRLADQLDEPIFTPAAKADHGHDENIDFEAVIRTIGPDAAHHVRQTTLVLYREAARHASRCGIILADTKFEFGVDTDGHIILIDEALTPDSSRYWPADGYQPGMNPPSFDKQFVRDYLEAAHWDKTPPAPALPDDVIIRTRALYLEAYHRLTGETLVADVFTA